MPCTLTSIPKRLKTTPVRQTRTSRKSVEAAVGEVLFFPGNSNGLGFRV